MSALNDGRCEKCNRRMGWPGKAADKPACSGCGHVPTKQERKSLEDDDRMMEAAMIELFGDDDGEEDSSVSS